MPVWFSLSRSLLELISFVDRVKVAITNDDPGRQVEELDGMILRKLRMFREANKRLIMDYNSFDIEYQDGYLFTRIFYINKKTNTATLELLQREGFEIVTKGDMTMLKLKLEEKNWLSQRGSL